MLHSYFVYQSFTFFVDNGVSVEYLFLSQSYIFSSGCHQWEYSQWTGFACQRPEQEQVNSYLYIFNLWMVGGSVFMVYMGYLYIWAMVVVIQMFMETELFNLLYAVL